MSVKRIIKKQLRRTAMRIVKPFPPLRNAARVTLRKHRGRIYRQIRRNHPTEPRTIIFESFMGRSYSDNPRAIYEYMLTDHRFDDYHFIWIFKKAKLEELANNLPEPLRRAELVQAGTPEAYAAYARAAIWLTNSRLADYLQPRKNQRYIQTWHGTALKRLGHDIELDGGNAMYTHQQILDKNDQDARRYSAMVSPSPFMTKVYNSSFDLPNINPKCQIWQDGYPRNDKLVKPSKRYINQLKKQFDLPKDKQIILYAPTWRDNQHQAGTGYTYKPELDFNKLYQEFGDTHVILFRAHYFIANHFDFAQYDGFVRDVSGIDDISDLYLVSDMLVTDYSSTMFDYAILRRPIVLFMYDLADYRDKLHGFYLPLASLPGPITETTDELIAKLRRPPKITKKYDQFVNKYAPLDDGHASQRVAERILNIHTVSTYNHPSLKMIKPKLHIRDNQVIISGPCLVKLMGHRSFNPTKFTLHIADHGYPISFQFKRWHRMPRKYQLNSLEVKIPLTNTQRMDIQNKLLVCYDDDTNNMGRIIFKLTDGNKGQLRHSKICITDGLALYLRQTVANTAYLTVRQPNKLDLSSSTAKIALAWLAAKLTPPRDIILMFEKECERYQESASVLYERLRQLGYNNIYYIIDKTSPEFNYIPSNIRDNVIDKHSWKHIYYFFKTKKFVGTETIGHAIQLRCANRLIVRKEQSPKLQYVFLQHGVMYMVSLNSPSRKYYHKQNRYKTHKVVVSSSLEKQHFIDLAGFDDTDVYATGLPKFDKSYRNDSADKIIIMPTWRRWEANQVADNYLKTGYYKMIARIIDVIPVELKDKILVLPHPLMADALKSSGKFNDYLPDPTKPYDELLRDCRLLITDYSSIAYDAFYRGANVIFDWCEKDECMEKYGKGTFLMLNGNNAFGAVHYREDTAMTKSINKLYKSKQPSKYIVNYRHIVKFHDNHNTERLIKKLQREEII